MSRYDRQMILPEVGPHGQARLAAAHVLVVGAGGLAAPVLPLLAGAGVGRITLVDDDTVALSNLHRQSLFTESSCGQPKAQVAAQRCRVLNADCEVTPLVQRLTPANAPGLVAGADLVLDCADSYAVSYMLSDLCLGLGVPLISGSALGMSGYAGGFCGGAPSLRAVFPQAPDSGASCETAGVLGPVVAMIGTVQAQMALSVILGVSPSPLGQLVRMEAGGLRPSAFRFDGAPEPVCGFGFVAADQLCPADMIFDLRPTAPLLHPMARRVAQPELARDLHRNPPPLNTRLALCCVTGLRAWRAAETIHEIWPGEIVLVAACAC